MKKPRAFLAFGALVIAASMGFFAGRHSVPKLPASYEIVVHTAQIVDLLERPPVYAILVYASIRNIGGESRVSDITLDLIFPDGTGLRPPLQSVKDKLVLHTDGGLVSVTRDQSLESIRGGQPLKNGELVTGFLICRESFGGRKVDFFDASYVITVTDQSGSSFVQKVASGAEQRRLGHAQSEARYEAEMKAEEARAKAARDK